MSCSTTHNDGDAFLLSGCCAIESALTGGLWFSVFGCHNAAFDTFARCILYWSSIGVSSALQCDGITKDRSIVLGDNASNKPDHGISDGTEIRCSRRRSGFDHQLQPDLVLDDWLLPG